MTMEKQQTKHQLQLQTLEEFKKMGIQINLEDALLTAIQTNKPYNVQKLLALGADPNVLVKDCRPNGNEKQLEKRLSLASYAAFHNKIQALQLLIKYGADLEKTLETAIEADHKAAVRLLTDQPINKSKLLPSGYTWITYAIHCQAFDALEILLNRGYDAQKESEIYDFTKVKYNLHPYQHAVTRNKWPAFLMLLKHGIPFPKTWSNYQTSTLLFDAHSLENEELQELLELNKEYQWANLNTLNEKGETIAFDAAYDRKIRTIRLMAYYGLDLSIKNKYGVTVFERVYEAPFGELFTEDKAILKQLKEETYPELKKEIPTVSNNAPALEEEPDPLLSKPAPKKRKPRKDPNKKGIPTLSYAKKTENMKRNMPQFVADEQPKINLIRERKEKAPVRPVARHTHLLPRTRSGGRGM